MRPRFSLLLLKPISSIVGHFPDPNSINLKSCILAMLVDTQIFHLSHRFLNINFKETDVVYTHSKRNPFPYNCKLFHLPFDICVTLQNLTPQKNYINCRKLIRKVANLTVMGKPNIDPKKQVNWKILPQTAAPRSLLLSNSAEGSFTYTGPDITCARDQRLNVPSEGHHTKIIMQDNTQFKVCNGTIPK